MSSLSILIVEDEAIVAEDLARKIRQLGYAVAGMCATGEEAVELTRQQRPALVLMDIHLAGRMDGVAAAELIHRECHLPVLFLTAHSDAGTVERARKAEAFGYILKPFDERDLHIQIEMALYKHAAELRLRESAARFRSLFHHSSTPIAVKLPDGRFLEVNQAYCEMLGYSETEVLDATIDDFIYPEGSHAAEAMRRLMAGDITVLRTPKRYLHKRGHPVWCDTSVSVVPDAAGGVAYVIVQAHDVTARKEAEEQVRKLNLQLESLVLERTGKLRETVKSLKAEIVQRQRLEREILDISEREQWRFGQDLHDGLGQELAGIARLGDVHARQLQAENHPSAAAAAKIATYVRSSIDSSRRLAKGLYPIDLDRYGLLFALKDLAEQTSQRSGIPCQLRQSGEPPNLEKSAEIHIYRIVQECLGNAVKHGRPHHISIESLARADMHTFTVTDDGIGFDKASVTAGMGLHLIEYRARVIGAEIIMERPAEGGSRITCCLPMGPPGHAPSQSPV
ncbi:MAG: PAS domain S-box protein [Verrucomicrobiota bacterium]